MLVCQIDDEQHTDRRIAHRSLEITITIASTSARYFIRPLPNKEQTHWLTETALSRSPWDRYMQEQRQGKIERQC